MIIRLHPIIFRKLFAIKYLFSLRTRFINIFLCVPFHVCVLTQIESYTYNYFFVRLKYLFNHALCFLDWLSRIFWVEFVFWFFKFVLKLVAECQRFLLIYKIYFAVEASQSLLDLPFLVSQFLELNTIMFFMREHWKHCKKYVQVVILLCM